MSQELNKPIFSHWFSEQKQRQDSIGALARKYTKKMSFYTLTDAIEAANTSNSEMVLELRIAYKAYEEYEKL